MSTNLTIYLLFGVIVAAIVGIWIICTEDNLCHPLELGLRLTLLALVWPVVPVALVCEQLNSWRDKS